jgi:S-adenosylmethionine hydrolase
VHLAVVDPGVGSDRPAVAIAAGEHFFVGPDNGLFTFVPEETVRMVTLTVPPNASPTFHGRDVFAPAAGRLSAGSPVESLGQPARGPRRLKEGWASKVGEAWRAMVLHCDRFGNVITNLPPRAAPHLRTVNGIPVKAVRTYADGDSGQLLTLVGSSGRLEIALRESSAAARLRAAPGQTLVIT